MSKSKLHDILRYVDGKIHLSTRQNISAFLYLFFKNTKTRQFDKNIVFIVQDKENLYLPPFYSILEDFYKDGDYLNISARDEEYITIANKKILDLIVDQYIALSQKEFFLLCADEFHTKKSKGDLVSTKDIFKFFGKDRQLSKKP